MSLLKFVSNVDEDPLLLVQERVHLMSEFRDFVVLNKEEQRDRIRQLVRNENLTDDEYGLLFSMLWIYSNKKPVEGELNASLRANGFNMIAKEYDHRGAFGELGQDIKELVEMKLMVEDIQNRYKKKAAKFESHVSTAVRLKEKVDRMYSRADVFTKRDPDDRLLMLRSEIALYDGGKLDTAFIVAALFAHDHDPEYDRRKLKRKARKHKVSLPDSMAFGRGVNDYIEVLLKRMYPAIEAHDKKYHYLARKLDLQRYRAMSHKVRDRMPRGIAGYVGHLKVLMASARTGKRDRVVRYAYKQDDYGIVEVNLMCIYQDEETGTWRTYCWQVFVSREKQVRVEHAPFWWTGKPALGANTTAEHMDGEEWYPSEAWRSASEQAKKDKRAASSGP